MYSTLKSIFTFFGSNLDLYSGSDLRVVSLSPIWAPLKKLKVYREEYKNK